MNRILRPGLAALLLLASACTPVKTPEAPPAPAKPPPAPAPKPAPPARALTLSAYKEAVAHHISRISADHVFTGQPHSMLRAVIVQRVVLDGEGRLLSSEILRSNRDPHAENVARESLRAASPLPRPPANLLARDRLEIIETWLFARDGRFQLRTIAEPQARE